MRLPVFLDYNSTTPVDEGVLATMTPFFTEAYGNSSSRDHSFGWDAAEAVEEARGQVADLINADPGEIVFTSGATEGINCALRAIADINRRQFGILTSSTEHESTLGTCSWIEQRQGARVQYVPVDRNGRLEIARATAAVNRREVDVVCAMLANNEIGTIHPLHVIGAATKSANVLLFSDITQAVGKRPVDVRLLGLDAAVLSAHKIYGPKGVGALFVSSRNPSMQLQPLIVGGGQERGLRAGTLNVPAVVGFGEACRLAKARQAADVPAMALLRDRLEERIRVQVPRVWINGDTANRLCNTSNVGFKGVDARTLIRDMHDIACSTRSACSSGNSGPSHVLKAIGLSDEDAYSCIRFSLGRFTTEEEIDYTIGKVVTSVHKLRSNKSVRV